MLSSSSQSRSARVRKATLRAFARLWRDEEGQSLVFGIISVFLILLFGAMVVAVGRVSARRIQMQFAADSSAYSASLVESECLNSIATLNTGMAQVRARSLRLVADVNSYGVLSELRDQVMGLGDTMASALNEQIAGLTAQLDSETDPERRAAIERQIQVLTDRLESMHEGGEMSEPLLTATDEAFWRQQIDVLQAALAVATDELTRADLQDQIAYCEQMLGGLQGAGGGDPDWVQAIVGMDRPDLEYADAYARAAEWQDAANAWLREMSRLEYSISIIAPYQSADTAYRTASENGAEYTSIFPATRWLPRRNAYLSLEVQRLGEGWWRVWDGSHTMEVEAQDCRTCTQCPSCGRCTGCWLVSWLSGATEQGRYRVCQLEGDRWFFEDMISAEVACIQQVEEFHVVTWGPEGVEVQYHDEYTPRWIEVINTRGSWPRNTMFIRNVDGVVETANYQWDAELEKWLLPEESDFLPLPAPGAMVDGVRVSVTLDPVIQLPGRAVLRTLEPPYVELLDLGGNPWGRAYLDRGTRFWTIMNSTEVWVENDDFHLRRRGEYIYRSGADGRWRSHFDPVEEYWWQHRLSLLEPSRWEYEYMEFGARLQRERNMFRLLAQRDVEPDSPPPDQSSPALSMPTWAYEPTYNPAGWLDPATGSLVREFSGSPIGNTYKYYQVRPCWDPFDTNFGTEEPDGKWWFDYNGDGVQDEGETMDCPTCGGKGYVVVEPSAVFGRLGQAARTESNPRRPAVRPDDFQQAYLNPQHMPLVLSEDFFKYGLTCGVWHRRESHFGTAPGRTGDLERPVEYLLHDPEPGLKGLMRGQPATTARQRGERLMPPWGYFAVAAARPKLERPGEAASSDSLRAGGYFADADARRIWVAEDFDNLYVRDYSGGWSSWDAGLIALSRQVLDEDVMLQQTIQAQTGTGWLMERIAMGSPGGLVRSLHQQWWPNQPHYGTTAGWATDLYGGYLQSYPPEWVRRDLTRLMRPRQPTPVMGRHYTDQEGLLRDPLVEYLGTRPFGPQPTGSQLDYGQLDERSVVH